MLREQKLYGLVMGLLLCSAQVSAMPVSLVLDHIHHTRATEESGDELYFHVTSYTSSGNTHYQVPSFPHHWYSDALSSVKNVVLWEHELKSGESAEVVLSLTERDAPPWNIDDLIGSVKVALRNESGVVKEHWALYADAGHTQPTDGHNTHEDFKMVGDHGDYEVGLRLEQ